MKIIDLKERFSKSLVAGAVSSVIMLALNLFSYYVLHVSKRRFINYSALMIFGRKFNNLAEGIISSIAQIGFATALFMMFSYLILKKPRTTYILRGLCIGFGSWFAIMSLSYIIGIHKILPIDIGSAISFMITSSIWGIFGAWLLRILDLRYGTESEDLLENDRQRLYRGEHTHILPSPAMKKKQKR